MGPNATAVALPNQSQQMMESTGHGSISDINSRAAKIADPGVDLKTKHTIAGELRDLIDALADPEYAQVLPHFIPTIVGILRSGEVSFQKDSLDAQFRRILVEILHRIPFNDHVRPMATIIFAGMLHILRHDNEENGVTCSKAIMDLIRAFKSFPQDLIPEFFSILQELLRNAPGLVEEFLADDSLPLDPNTMLPSVRSFKVLSELSILIVTLVQLNRTTAGPILQSCLSLNVDLLTLESPSQKKAREDFESMGGIWSGMAESIKNPQLYSDFINCQIKMSSLLFWAIRGVGEQNDAYGEKLLLSSVRLLQDCPANATVARKDLWVVITHLMRHLLPIHSGRVLLTQLDKLLDENVLLGTSTSKESLRATPYSAIGDFIHHHRQELTAAQVTRIMQLYSVHLHNSCFQSTLMPCCTKVLFILIDILVAKETSANAARVLTTLLEICVDKLEPMAVLQDELVLRVEKAKKGENVNDILGPAFIERAKPVGAAAYALERPEEFFSQTRSLFRTLLHGFRLCLQSLRKLEAPAPDGQVISRMFEGGLRCLAHFAGDREAGEAMDGFTQVLMEVNPHVFQEVWTQKIGFYYQATMKTEWLYTIASGLFGRENISPTLVSIMLNFLVERLPSLGDMTDQQATIVLRFYKLTFSAVTQYPATNEPILTAHLSKLMMDCFPLTVKAKNPLHYLQLLRLLFRVVGAGGGRFELLCKEVLPLIHEMLEGLNRLLMTSEGAARDLIVELCLTFPLRLTHLLPHLGYLMQPLVQAFRGGPDLVQQGLRTLELCIDNLNPAFLDPTMGNVLRELMEALHNHLKPLPGNHIVAHTTIRVLGKLGGRNRKLLYKEPALKWKEYSEPAKVPVSLGGFFEGVAVGPMSVLAAKSVRTAKPPYRLHAYTFLENCLTFIVQEGIKNRDLEAVFLRALEGVFDGIHVPEVMEQAVSFIHSLSLHIIVTNIRSSQSNDTGLRHQHIPIFEAFLNAIPHALTHTVDENAKRSQDLMTDIIRALVSMRGQDGITPSDILATLTKFGHVFTAMCLDELWTRKNAGWRGIRIMTSVPDLGIKWLMENEPELVRTLLHVLKDLAYELPRDEEEVTDVLIRVLRVGNDELKSHTPSDSGHARSRLSHLIGVFCLELSSAHPAVRRATQTCIGLLLQASGEAAPELLGPHRDRTLAAIYTKPLRALAFPLQIGMMEAVRYCISLDPPLLEVNDELLRLLHETLALADADDLTGFAQRGGNPRQNALDIIKLRVACIKLLTASMPITDFFSKQTQTRTRVTSVYFKSLYSPSPEVKQVAHEGLRMVLLHQNRLPKELLQTGLRPILMNLADPKRLSIPGLEGLARLLELLTNYFKVEIGHKLLDHFRSVADPQMLQASSRFPLSENDGITKLVRLANIFHLLPSAASQFMSNLVNSIVQTEAQLHFSGCSPLSEPLAKYLDRYPVDALDFFMQHLHLPRHVRTLRSILQAKLAPRVQCEIASRTSVFVTHCIKGSERTMILPTLMLFSDMLDISPYWIAENDYVVDALLGLWRTDPSQLEQHGVSMSEILQRHKLVMSIFIRVLERSPRIDLLFALMTIYTRTLALDLLHLTRFLYEHVALNPDLTYRRNVLMRFLTWFEDTAVPLPEKMHFLRLVVTPTLLVHAHSDQKRGLLDPDFIHHVHRVIWPSANDSAFSSTSNDMFKIELLHMTTVMVQHYHELLEDAKKDIIRCAWQCITSDDPLVKQTSYLLAARFFEAYPTPQKFLLRAWTGLLLPPHTEGRVLIQQALDILATILPRASVNEPGYPQWAKTTLRLLAEEGNAFSHTKVIYQLIVRQPQLFYPVRQLFVSHIVNCLWRLGLSSTASFESRLLSIDLVQVLFDWEQRAVLEDGKGSLSSGIFPTHTTSWARETIVSYLLRLATIPRPDPKVESGHDQQQHKQVVPRVLQLLQTMVAVPGWSAVTIKLHFFARALENNDLTANELNLSQAVNAAKVLHIISSDKSDAWYHENRAILQKLIQKGLKTEDHSLHDALYPIFERLMRLFPLPKEEEIQQGGMFEFHTFVYQAIGEGLNNTAALRGTLLMLNTVVQFAPERIEPFSAPITKLLGKLAKDHLAAGLGTVQSENLARLMISILDICQAAVAFLGESRRPFHATLVILVENSKSLTICNHLLELARSWALHKRDPYPTIKEKAMLLQKMLQFEKRGDGALFHRYLEMIYDIYTDPALRRSDLTTRLESAFLVGCRARDDALREKFMDLLDASVPRTLCNRLSYILGVQSWEALADHNWIYLALHLLLGCIDGDAALMPDRKITFSPSSPGSRPRQKARNIIHPLQRLLFLDPDVAHDTWASIFPAAWACLSRKEQADVTQHMISLLSKTYHTAQATMRPNVIQTLLAGVHACAPVMALPPFLVKYLAKTYGAWHVALEILGASLDSIRDEDTTVRDTVFDSLADVYSELEEDDMYYGLWRRRCLHPETNAALAFEQNGMWEHAMSVYESAQGKVRAGSIPFSEVEYCLWEDHWMLAAEKLQQWDLLYELARNDGNQELMLESAWRIKDWSDSRESLEEQIKTLPDAGTPRRRVFEAFLALLKSPAAGDKNAPFIATLEDAMQLSLRKWQSLPPHLSLAHVPLLQHFQQFVELQEAVSIFGSLAGTTAQNLEKKSAELKMVLQAWRERLPDTHDDISIWSDLVAWRQNVFNAINKAYIPLINLATGTNSGNTHGYRGYHETAWIINRFAHVARKHGLLEVCFNSLNKIYTLPNIEISEAFLKLREQARCYYQKPNDLQAGLEVINNTNLIYFSAIQKAEFFTLKAMFHARFGRLDEASAAFGQAIQLDMNQSKAWEEYGKFSDRMFKDHPNDLQHAANAVSCYFQAAALLKSNKSRPLLARILWLLSVDDISGTIARAFDTFTGDPSLWYWISLIPQLCLSVSQRESKQARSILVSIAKQFPQAVFFPLRTTREDMLAARKQIQFQAAARASASGQPIPPLPSGDTAEADHPMGGESKREGTAAAPSNSDVPRTPAVPPNSQPGGSESGPSFPRQPWEHIEELFQILKTSFPLLILGMETIVDQLTARFKASPEEEIYRLVCMLMQDCLMSYVSRMLLPEDDGQLLPNTIQNLERMAQSLTGTAGKEYHEDFLNDPPALPVYLRRLQKWRDKYERFLDARPHVQSLEIFSHYLAEFQYGKVDEIEVPGQYTEEKEIGHAFTKIQKFGPKVENCRTHGYCWKRFTIYGHDHSRTTFSVQFPSGRHCRREERVVQLFRTFNTTLARKKECRKRNLSFHLPVAVSCSPNLRLLQTDSSYVNLSDIFDQHCQEIGITKEDPILLQVEKIKQVMREVKSSQNRAPIKNELLSLKKDAFDEVVLKMVPDDILTRYMIRTMEGPSELWRMRKQFALQLAATSFMTYIVCLTSRTPGRFHFSRKTGRIAMSELLPGTHPSSQVFATSDHVPFRFTPNLQQFIGPIALEGIFTTGILAIARSLTDPEYELDQHLCLFARDEVMTWLHAQKRQGQLELGGFRNVVATAIDGVVKRAETMACKVEREQATVNALSGHAPVVQTVTSLISIATNPHSLSKMQELYCPWF